jgi:hypothetical protein
METTTWAASLVTLILAVGSGIGWLIRRRDQRKDPLPKREAELVLAEQALGIVKAAAEFSAGEAVTLRGRVTQLEMDRDDLRNRMVRIEGLFARALSYIETLLRIWPDAPPPPPPPRELHDLIDSSLWRNPEPKGTTP